MGKNSTVVAISFSPPGILKEAKARASRLGFKNSFSAYVTKLVENDLAGAGRMHESSPDYRTNSASGLAAAHQALDAGVAAAHASTTALPLPAKPTKYKVARSSKKKPTP